MKKNYRYFILFFLFAACMLLLAGDTLAQCSMCRKIATDGTTTRSVANGLNKGILYLLAFPYAMIVFIFRKQIGNFIRGLRKK